MVTGRRFLAAALDAAVLFLCHRSLGLESWLWLWLLQVPFSLSEWVWSRTPGKWLCGLRVLHRSGVPATGWQRTGRWLLRNNAALLVLLSVSGVPFLFFAPLGGGAFVAGCLLALRPSGQAGHDLLTDTCVR